MVAKEARPPFQVGYESPSQFSQPRLRAYVRCTAARRPRDAICRGRRGGVTGFAPSLANEHSAETRFATAKSRITRIATRTASLESHPARLRAEGVTCEQSASSSPWTNLRRNPVPMSEPRLLRTSQGSQPRSRSIRLPGSGHPTRDVWGPTRVSEAEMHMKRRHAVEDLDPDIRDHIERETADNIDRGSTPDDARAAARGKEDARGEWLTKGPRRRVMLTARRRETA